MTLEPKGYFCYPSCCFYLFATVSIHFRRSRRRSVVLCANIHRFPIFSFRILCAIMEKSIRKVDNSMTDLERRHIQGEYRLTADDLIGTKIPEDTILLAANSEDQ